MKKQFTLVEILVVVFLIGLLTALGFGMYSYAMNSSRERATRALFARIEAAIESCNTKLGYIPASTAAKKFNPICFKVESDGTISAISFQEDLTNKTVSDEYRKEFLKIIDAESLKSSINSSHELTDSWGETIFYAYPGKFNKTSYDLYSAGADGKLGEVKSGITPTNPTAANLDNAAIGDFKDTSDNTMLCDDIINF